MPDQFVIAVAHVHGHQMRLYLRRPINEGIFYHHGQQGAGGLTRGRHDQKVDDSLVSGQLCDFIKISVPTLSCVKENGVVILFV